ncbi:MAG: aminoacyl-tRNA hydrolase [Candidatus Roizmanbacteria bacterium]
MKLIVGLGNPDKNHLRNRHNVGWMAIDFLSSSLKDYFTKENHSILSTIREFDIKGERILLIKPITYMNNSGESVSALSRFYKIEPKDIYVIHDDLDIPLGQYKVQFEKSPKGHNGILSIEEKLGTKGFWRIRIGVENRTSENKIPGEKYVLENFTKDEEKTIKEIFNKILTNNTILNNQ